MSGPITQRVYLLEGFCLVEGNDQSYLRNIVWN